MSEPRRPGQHRREAPASLPDPALWREDREQWKAVVRVFVFGALLLAGVGGSALVLRGTLGRAAAVRAQAAPLLQGLGGGALPAGLEPPRPAEKPPLSPEELAALQRSWVASVSIAPRDARVDPDTGERLGAFQGFGVQVDGAQGARVLADGTELGTAPLLASVSCRPGEPVEIRVERGEQSWSHRTVCRRDALLELTPRLAKGK
jgi:hypothetical protein